MGYHVKEIPRGTYGDLSKVAEELAEALDAEEQHNPVMVLVELSDIVGAVDGYLEKRFQGTVKLKDLVVMAKATQRAFKEGERTCKDPTSTTNA